MKPTRYNVVLLVAGSIITVWTTPPIVGGEVSAVALAASRNSHAEILACKPLN